MLNNTGSVTSNSGILRITVSGSSAATFSAGSAAILEFATSYTFTDGATFSGAGTIQFDDNVDAHVSGAINNSGTILLQSSGNLTRLFLDGNTSFSGGGTIVLSSVPGNSNVQIAGSSIFTNVDNLIEGQGNIGANAVQFVNEANGIFNANVAGQVLVIDPNGNGFNNQGLLEATAGGILQLNGNAGGSFTNSGTILADGAGSEVQLANNVAVAGGTLSAINGGLVHAISGQSVFLSNLTIAGSYLNDDNADTHVSGTMTNTGTITLNSLGNLSRLILDGDTILNGGGTITLISTSNLNAQISGGSILTNVDNLIQGTGNIGANGVQFINQVGGIFDANVTGQILFVDPNGNGFSNAGILEATNGGILQLSGNAGGDFTNSGTIVANGSGSEVQFLSSVHITGGTLETLNDGIIRTLSGQTAFLADLTNTGTYVDNDNADTQVHGTITNTGTMTFNSAGNLSRLFLNGDTTLAGGGTITLVSTSNLNAQISGGFTLTNVDNLIQGSGNIGTNGVQFINQAGGVFDANVTGQVLFFDPNGNGFTNQGLIEATNGGIVQLSGNAGGAFTNTGALILADGAGSEVQLLSNVSIAGGTLEATNGGLLHALAGQSVFLSNLTIVGGYLNDDNADTHVSGTITNTDTITLSSLGNLSRFFLDGDTSLDGGGTLILTSTSNLNAQISGSGILTNVDNLIQGSGNIGANGVQFINQIGGVFDANVTGAILFFDPNGNGFANHGLIEATNGGIVQLSGNAGGDFTNTGATILADGTGSEVQLTAGVTVTGGALNTTNGGIFRTLGGQTVHLVGLTNTGTFITDNNADTHISGTIVNTGSFTFNANGSVTRLFLDSNSTLTGGGVITLASLDSASSEAQITGGFLLTNFDNIIQGQGNLGANSTQFLNQAGGTIDANNSGKTLVIDPSAAGFVNQGLLEATNGAFLQLTGNAGGAFVNTGATILASGLNSEVQLTNSVSITGGTLSTMDGGIFHVLDGQIIFLANLTNAGTFINGNNADTHVSGTITNTGSITLNAGANLSRLFLDADTILTGSGTLTLASIDANNNAQITGGFLLTNVNNLIQGQGNLGVNSTQFLNQAAGIINANINGQVLAIDPSAAGFVNQGLLEATNGAILQLTGNAGGAFINTGATILADGTGSEVQLVNSVSLTGGTLSTSEWRRFSRPGWTNRLSRRLDQ